MTLDDWHKLYEKVQENNITHRGGKENGNGQCIYVG